MGKSIDDLAIVVSASTDQLAGDLRRAAQMVAQFSKEVARNQPDMVGAKASSIDFAGMKRSARASGIAAASEFTKSFRSVKESISLPSKAMISGGTGAALADPFIVATAAAETFAAVAAVPFHAIAAGAHLAAAVIGVPFKIAGLAVEGLSGMVGGLIPVIGSTFSFVGKLAGGVMQLTGSVLSGLASGIGTAFSAMGDVVGKVLGGIAKVGIQSVAIAFEQVRESVNLAAEVEQTKISFDVLVGSATKATEVLAGLRKFAAETPFSQKDITGSGKQLLGYGVSADQLVPSIKMLGDVSAATGKPLSELVYLYGTLINQDRAYTVDIKQFATAGIRIYEELGKVLGVTSDRVREMVEAGRVGIPEVQKAFINMTSAGGQFYGMMAQQANSFAGIREQLSDAWDVAKARLGEAVIEELGLKDAAKDVTRFVETLHTKIDSIRPAIRFMGELGRGVASAGIEFAKAAAQFVSINVESIGASFPKQAVHIKGMIEDLKNFKMDPKKLGLAAFDVAESLVSGFDSVLQWMSTEGARYKNMFMEDFVDPAKELLSSLKDVAGFLKLFNPTSNDFKNGMVEIGRRTRIGESGVIPHAGTPFSETAFDKGYRDRIMGDRSDGSDDRAKREFGLHLFNAMNNADRFGPIQPGESADSASRRYRELDIFVGMGRHLVNDRGQGQYKEQLDALTAMQRDNFISPFTKDFDRDSGAISGKYWANQMPGKNEFGGPAAQTVKEPSTLQRIKAQWLERMNATSGEAATATRGFRDALAGVVGPAFLARDAVGSIAKMTTKFAPWGSDVMEAAKKAREEHGIDPRQLIANEFAALQKSAAIGAINFAGDYGLAAGHKDLPGGIDAGTYQRAVGALAERAESLLGPSRLPDATMKDTTESVRLLNQWQNGNGQQTTEALFKRMVDLLEQQLGVQKRLAPDIAKDMPAVVPLGPN